MGRQIFIREVTSPPRFQTNSEWQDREQEPRFGSGDRGGHRGGHNAGGYGGYPRGGYQSGGGAHQDTTGRQVYVGNVYSFVFLSYSSSRTRPVGRILKTFSAAQVAYLRNTNLL